VGRHLTRVAIVSAVALLAIGAGSAGATGNPTRSIAAVDQLESQVLAELNKIRRDHGLVPLKLSRPLATAADTHSKAMGTHGFFQHESRDGSEFWKRVKRFYGPAKSSNWSVGENLLWSSGHLDAATALKLWMESPGHRKVILTPRWREVGLSAVSVTAAPGVFGGRDVTIVTADFGARS
jgi:uncharacterized protein YkwD